MPTPSGCPAIGARLRPSDGSERSAVHVTIGPGGQTVDAPIAPGVVTTVPVSAWKLMDVGDGVDIGLRPCTIAPRRGAGVERRGGTDRAGHAEERRPARRGRGEGDSGGDAAGGVRWQVGDLRTTAEVAEVAEKKRTYCVWGGSFKTRTLDSSFRYAAFGMTGVEFTRRPVGRALSLRFGRGCGGRVRFPCLRGLRGPSLPRGRIRRDNSRLSSSPS